MTDWSIAVIAVATLGASFLSGIFGMVGGAILIGVFLLILPVPAAMTLHAVAQMTANGQRALLWRPHIMWLTLLGYMLGAAIAFIMMAIMQFSPPKPVIYLCLGILPFAALLVPQNLILDIRHQGTSVAAGILVMVLMTLAGVPGPTLDIFFQTKELDRRVVVATKAAMQTLGNILKSVYFSFIVVVQVEPGQDTSTPELSPWILAMTILMAVCGTMLAKPVLHYFSDSMFHRWSRRLILGIGALYLLKGVIGLTC
jgi:uncharacterized membrane protein YfcA